jgi:hypothetical protein
VLDRFVSLLSKFPQRRNKVMLFHELVKTVSTGGNTEASAPQHTSPPSSTTYPYTSQVARLRKSLAAARLSIAKLRKRPVGRSVAIAAGGRRRSVQKARLCPSVPKGAARDKGAPKKPRMLSWHASATCGLTKAQIVTIEKQLQCKPYRKVYRTVIGALPAKMQFTKGLQYLFNMVGMLAGLMQWKTSLLPNKKSPLPSSFLPPFHP